MPVRHSSAGPVSCPSLEQFTHITRSQHIEDFLSCWDMRAMKPHRVKSRVVEWPYSFQVRDIDSAVSRAGWQIDPTHSKCPTPTRAAVLALPHQNYLLSPALVNVKFSWSGALQRRIGYHCLFSQIMNWRHNHQPSAVFLQKYCNGQLPTVVYHRQLLTMAS